MMHIKKNYNKTRARAKVESSLYLPKILSATETLNYCLAAEIVAFPSAYRR